MKMYVWNKDVLKDYGYGMIVIHAKNITQARQIALDNNLQDELRSRGRSGKWKWKKPDKTFYGKGCVSQMGSA